MLSSCISTLALTIALVGQVRANNESNFRIPTGERQLFLDDVGISQINNLRRTMHQPTKRGAVIRPDRDWETTLQTRCRPAWDEQESVFKLWMITSTNLPGEAGTTYATSKDGVQWIKPVLGQWEFQGSRNNNFVALDPQMPWPENAIENVVYDPDDPIPARRYKGLLGAINRRPMISPDGINWTLLNVPAIPSQDESNLSYDRHTRTFIATVKHGGPYGRSVHLSTSRDFEHWTKPKLIFHADKLDQQLGREHIKARRANPNIQMQRPLWDIRDTYKDRTAEPKVDVYNMGLFRYEGLYIGTPAMFHSNGNRWNQDGFHLIQLVCSRDLKTFERLGNRQTFIGPSPMGQGAYDLTQLLGPSAPIIRGDELWFYYTGIKYRTPPKNPDRDTGAICLAVLRRDGFISLDAGPHKGTILTEPFTVGASMLRVNVDAPTGELHVEVLDENRHAIAKSEPLSGNLLRRQVKWSEGHIAEMKGRKVSLRFTLRNGQFYSYWLE